MALRLDHLGNLRRRHIDLHPQRIVDVDRRDGSALGAFARIDQALAHDAADQRADRRAGDLRLDARHLGRGLAQTLLLLGHGVLGQGQLQRGVFVFGLGHGVPFEGFAQPGLAPCRAVAPGHRRAQCRTRAGDTARHGKVGLQERGVEPRDRLAACDRLAGPHQNLCDHPVDDGRDLDSARRTDRAIEDGASGGGRPGRRGGRAAPRLERLKRGHVLRLCGHGHQDERRRHGGCAEPGPCRAAHQRDPAERSRPIRYCSRAQARRYSSS